MAAASNMDTLGLLATAEMARESVGMEVYLASEQARKIALDGVVTRTTLQPGESFYIPKLGRETVVTRFSKTTTDGSTFSTTTFEGQDITTAAIDDSPVQMQQKFQYTGFKYGKESWNRMTVPQRQMYVNGRIVQGGKALGRSMDASVLSLAVPTLQASGNQLNSGTPQNFAETDIALIYKIAEENNWTGLIHLCLDPSQVVHVDAIQRLRFHQVAGVGGGPMNTQRIYTDGDQMVVFFHNDVYDDGVDGYHGLFWVQESLAFQEIVGMQVDDWYENKEKTFYASPETDYVYAIQDNELCGTIQTPRPA